jgi:hypothetical protein
MHGCLDFGQGKRRNAILLCCDTAASQQSRKEFWMCLSGHCRLRNDDCELASATRGELDAFLERNRKKGAGN